MTSYSIGEISKKTGIPSKTIRFYEEKSLIKSTRKPNGYREYHDNTIETLILIKDARGLDLSLEEIKNLMYGCHTGSCAHTKEYVKSVIHKNLTETQNKIAELTSLSEKLQHLDNEIEKNKSEGCTYCCDVLQQIIKISQKKGGENINEQML